jgi:hypothetical protein
VVAPDNATDGILRQTAGGNTYCQPHSFGADGYFRCGEYGR